MSAHLREMNKEFSRPFLVFFLFPLICSFSSSLADNFIDDRLCVFRV